MSCRYPRRTQPVSIFSSVCSSDQGSQQSTACRQDEQGATAPLEEGAQGATLYSSYKLYRNARERENGDLYGGVEGESEELAISRAQCIGNINYRYIRRPVS